jgi:hypothetical protein
MRDENESLIKHTEFEGRMSLNYRPDSLILTEPLLGVVNNNNPSRQRYTVKAP